MLYLRALGAKVGRGAAIFSRHVPVCTDLLTIGDGTVIRKDSFFTGYRAHAGRIQTGAVTLGQDVFVGEKTVLDIGTSMGDGAQLGHSSSLTRRTGRARRRALARLPRAADRGGLPEGRPPLRHLRRAVLHRPAAAEPCSGYLPLAFGGAVLRSREPSRAQHAGPGHVASRRWTFYRDALVISLVLFFGVVLVGLLSWSPFLAC